MKGTKRRHIPDAGETVPYPNSHSVCPFSVKNGAKIRRILLLLVLKYGCSVGTQNFLTRRLIGVLMGWVPSQYYLPDTHPIRSPISLLVSEFCVPTEQAQNFEVLKNFLIALAWNYLTARAKTGWRADFWQKSVLLFDMRTKPDCSETSAPNSACFILLVAEVWEQSGLVVISKSKPNFGTGFFFFDAPLSARADSAQIEVCRKMWIFVSRLGPELARSRETDQSPIQLHKMTDTLQ